MSDLWGKLKLFFDGFGNDPTGNIRGTDVNRPNSTSIEQMTGKKFEVKGIRNVSVRRGNFNVTVSSRPRRCPLCHSEGSVKKAEILGKRWNCKVCGYRW